MSVTEVGTALAPATSSGNTTAVTGTWNGNQPRTAGHFLVACVTTWGTTTGVIGSFTAGWTQQAPKTSSDSRGVTVIYTKVAAGSDAAPTFTPNDTGTSASAQSTLELHEYSGQDTVTPVGTTGTGATTTSPVTITTAGTVGRSGSFAITSVLASTVSAGTGTYTPGTSWTNVSSQAGTSQRPHQATDTLSNPATGSTLSEAPTWSGGTLQGFTGSMIVIQPPGPPSGSAQGPYLPARRRLSRALIQSLRGSPPPAVPNKQQPLGPRPRPPQRAFIRSTAGTGRTPGVAPRQGPYLPARRRLARAVLETAAGQPPPIFGTANRQGPYVPARRRPARAMLEALRGSPPLAVPNRQRPYLPARRQLVRAAVVQLRGRYPAAAGGGGIQLFTDDERPWLKRMRVKWYRAGPPLESWYDFALPAGVASAYTASGGLAGAGPGQAEQDAAAAEPSSAVVPGDSERADRRVRGRGIARIRRRRYRPGRPVWSRDTVVSAAGDSFDHNRSKRLIDSYRLPRPGWRSSSEYSLPVIQRRERRARDSSPDTPAG